MRLYIKGNYDKNGKKLPFDYLELAQKMWFPETENKALSLSFGVQKKDWCISLEENAELSIRLNKQDVDERWENLKEKCPEYIGNITLAFEDSITSGYRSKREMLRITTPYVEALTLDKRAMYIMAVEVATAIDGEISEDDKKNWLTPEAFKEKYQDIFDLTYEEANEMSLEEVETIRAEHEPSWFEEVPDTEEEDEIPKEILQNPDQFRVYLYQLMSRYFNHEMEFDDFVWCFSIAMKDEDTCFGAFTAEEFVIISTMQAIISVRSYFEKDFADPKAPRYYFRIEEVEKRIAVLYQELKALNDAPKAQEEQPKKVKLNMLMKTFRKSFEDILGKFPQGTKAHQDEAGNVSFSFLISNTKVTFKVDSQNMLDILVDEHGKARSLWYFMRNGDAKRTGYVQDRGIFLGDEEAVKQNLEILKKHLYDTVSFGF